MRPIPRFLAALAALALAADSAPGTTLVVTSLDDDGPLLNEDNRRSRVVEIAKGGPLDGKGFPVKHSADWSAIAFSTDHGATWTALRGAVADATILLDRDQRGVAYSLRRTPIGAAAFESPASILVPIK